MERFVGCIRRERALVTRQYVMPIFQVVESGKHYNHFLHFLRYTMPFHSLNILHSRQKLILDPKSGLHAVGGALFYRERLRLERLKLAGLAQIDYNIGPALDLENC